MDCFYYINFVAKVRIHTKRLYKVESSGICTQFPRTWRSPPCCKKPADPHFRPEALGPGLQLDPIFRAPSSFSILRLPITVPLRIWQQVSLSNKIPETRTGKAPAHFISRLAGAGVMGLLAGLLGFDLLILGEEYGNGRPLPNLTVQLKFCAVILGDMLHDRKSQPSAAGSL